MGVAGYLARVKHLTAMALLRMGNAPRRHADDGNGDATRTVGEDCDDAIKQPLKYTRKDSRMLAFVIHKQSDPDFSKESLGNSINQGCQYITHFFKDIVEHSVVLDSSNNPSECSLVGIQEQIRVCSEAVGKDGLFVLYLSGHGRPHGFFPGDYSSAKGNTLSVRELASCLKVATRKAKYVLVILDCCCAGKITDRLVKKTPGNVYILSACTGLETTLASATLGCSLFTYFVGKALDNHPVSNCTLDLYNVHKDCQACVNAMTSLIMQIGQEGLQTSQYESKLERGSVDTDGTEMIVLCLETIKWLEERKCHCIVLEEKRAFNDGCLFNSEQRLLKLAISLLMYSVASTELWYKNVESPRDLDRVANPAIFLEAFDKVKEIIPIQQVTTDNVVDLNCQSLEFFWDALENGCGFIITHEQMNQRYTKFRNLLKNMKFDTGDAKVRIMIILFYILIFQHITILL